MSHPYGRTYWEGGNPDGSGYKGVGYQNFPVQLVVVNKILERKPESVLDIGAARGYIPRMLDQRGVKGVGVDISDYCVATRVTPELYRVDIEKQPLPFKDKELDLAFSLAVFEHLDESKLEFVIKEVARVCKRGLICPSFVDVGDADHTHKTLRPKEWWEKKFAEYAPGWPVEIVDKEEMEKGGLPFEQPVTLSNGFILSGMHVRKDFETLFGDNDRKVLLNIGSWVNQYRSTDECCVINMDIADLRDFAVGWGYNFRIYDARTKLPMPTGSADAIVVSHMLEHLTRPEGLAFLKECNRVLKPGGVIRIAVPSLDLLVAEYRDGSITRHGIYNPDIEKSTDAAEAFFHAVTGNHETTYGVDAMRDTLTRAGFAMPKIQYFCKSDSKLIMDHTFDMYPEISMYAEGTARGMMKSVFPKNTEKPRGVVAQYLNKEAIEGKVLL